MSRPRWAVLRLAARRSSGAAAARVVRRKRRGQGVAAGGGRWGVRPGGWRQKGFYSSYPRVEPGCSELVADAPMVSATRAGDFVTFTS
jgi:hypothetical protein